MKDRCQRNRAHIWTLCRVRGGIGIYECTVCKGHKWKRALTFFGMEKADGDYAPLTLGIIENQSKSSRECPSSQQPRSTGQEPRPEPVRRKGAKANQDTARKAARNAQRRRRYRLRKAAGLIAQWRFS